MTTFRKLHLYVLHLFICFCNASIRYLMLCQLRLQLACRPFLHDVSGRMCMLHTGLVASPVTVKHRITCSGLINHVAISQVRNWCHCISNAIQHTPSYCTFGVVVLFCSVMCGQQDMTSQYHPCQAGIYHTFALCCCPTAQSRSQYQAQDLPPCSRQHIIQMRSCKRCSAVK